MDIVTSVTQIFVVSVVGDNQMAPATPEPQSLVRFINRSTGNSEVIRVVSQCSSYWYNLCNIQMLYNYGIPLSVDTDFVNSVE